MYQLDIESQELCMVTGSIGTTWCHMAEDLSSIDADPIECGVREDVTKFTRN